MKPSLLTLMLAVIFFVACSSPDAGPSISIEEAWVRASMMPINDDAVGQSGAGNSAAYMIIKNQGREPDRLVGVTTVEDIAEFVEIHRSEMKDGVMTMGQVEGIDIPAGGEIALEPGGYHIMLINLKRTLTEGEAIKLVLDFKVLGSLMVDAEIRSP